MRLTVFGATGGIGRQLVSQALDAGHQVTAVVRDASRLGLSHRNLETVTVPGLTDPELLRKAVAGRDAVFSGVGAASRKAGTIASSATGVILEALRAEGVDRFIAVSAAPVGPIPEDEGFFHRRAVFPMIRAILREVYADLAVMEAAIAKTGDRWTVVRPPKLTDKALTGAYRLAIGGNVSHGTSISRADVAHAMLGFLDRPETQGKAVGIAN